LHHIGDLAALRCGPGRLGTLEDLDDDRIRFSVDVNCVLEGLVEHIALDDDIKVLRLVGFG
ncbi:hypothetical protein BGZ80_008781, partial [Entomortierella chlamydospora]